MRQSPNGPIELAANSIRANGWRRAVRWLPFVVAVVVVVVVARAQFRRELAKFEIDAVLVPTSDDEREFSERFAALRGLAAPGVRDLGGRESTELAPAAFISRAEVALDSLRSLSASSEIPTSRSFAIRSRIPDWFGPAEVSVVAIPEEGPELSLAPTEFCPSWVVGPGSIWLPEPPFALERANDGADRVRYSRGFFVPVGCRLLTVLVALKREDETEDPGGVHEVFERWIDPSTHRARVDRWKSDFRARGFSVSAFDVREP